MKKFYGPSVSSGLSRQRTPDAAAGFFLDAIVHCPDASPGTVKKWRKQIRLKEENDRLRRLRGTV
jgi:energy-converting hydrogenase Eha subunit B